jgi:hypothetical protein
MTIIIVKRGVSFVSVYFTCSDYAISLARRAHKTVSLLESLYFVFPFGFIYE